MILDEILEAKRGEVAAAKKDVPEQRLRSRPAFGQPRRGFTRALREAGGRAIIAEIKRASPSKGLLRADFRPAEHARDYQQAGAACLSVLTDSRFFGGSLTDLEAARGACALPVLRKDFLIDPYQVFEARAWGADAVLLIVAALEDAALRELKGLAEEQGLDALVEVHDTVEFERALAAGADLIGINNRDLTTFETSLRPSRELAPRAPGHVTLVAESGLDSTAQLRELAAVGVHAFLIGEHFMRAPHPGRALGALLEP